MKSFFTKLGTLLLCGVAVAVVGCTDFSEDIQAVGDKVDALEQQTAADIQKAIADLQASIDSKFATKEALAALESDLEGEISSQIASLKSTLETAINQKADKATVEAEFLVVKDDLADLEAALAAAKADLQAEIAKKADQSALDAALVRVAALEATVKSLRADVDTLITMIQQHEEALTNLANFQQTATEKLADLEAQDKALQALIETEVEDLYKEIGTVQEFASAIDRLYKEADAELLAKLNELDADVWAKIEVLDEAISAVNNLLADETENRENEDAQLQLQINTALESISAVNTILEENKAELVAKDADLENEINLLVNTTNTLTQTISAVNTKVDGVESALNAHIAAAAAYQKSLEETLEALKTAAGNHDFAITNINTLLEEAVKDIEVLVSDVAKIRVEVAQLVLAVTNNTGKIDANGMAIEDLQAANKEIIENIKGLVKATTDHATSIQTLTGNVEDLLAADKTMQGVISQLEAAVTNLTVGSATKEELDELRGDLNEGLKKVQDAVDAAEARIDELTKRVEANENAIVDLKKQTAALETAIEELQAADSLLKVEYEAADAEVKELIEKRRDELQKQIYALIDMFAGNKKAIMENADDIDAIEELVAANKEAIAAHTAQLNELLNTTLASLSVYLDEQFEAIEKNIQAASKTLNDLVGQLIEDLNGLIQSLVFVPEYANEGAALYDYTFFDEPLNNQVIVKGTYQVTPSNLVGKIGHDLEVRAALQPVKTRAAADAYVWSKEVIVTDVNYDNGKFDVEIIFDAEQYYNKNINDSYAMSLFVQHPDYAVAEPSATGDEGTGDMGVTTVDPASIVRTYMASDFVTLKEGYGYEITERYAIAALNAQTKKYVEYKNTVDMVPWSEKENARTPLADHEIVIKDNGEFITLAEAAKLYRVDVEDITPLFADNFILTDADGVSETVIDCNAQTVTPATEGTGELMVRTYAIKGTPTVKTAGNFVGHRVRNEFQLYFVHAEKEEAVKSYSYDYEIDYRTANLVLVGSEGAHEVVWNLENARKLSSQYKRENAYDLPIDKSFNSKFGEYQLPEGENAPDFDYEAVIKNITPTTKVYKGTSKVAMTVDVPQIKITPRTSLLHNVAEVSVTNYKAGFTTSGTTYKFVQTYFAEDLYTKVNFEYTLKLGAKPEKVDVNFSLEIPYSKNDYKNDLVNDDININTLAAAKFAKYLPANTTEYNPFEDRYHAKAAALYVAPEYDKVAHTAPTDLSIQKGLTVSAADLAAIYKNEDADGAARLVKTVPTWYGVDFNYIADFTITEPVYYIDTIDAYVDEDNQAYLNYQFINDKYVIENADLAHYFKVVNRDWTNTIKVRFNILAHEDGTTPTFTGGATTKDSNTNTLNTDGSFDPTTFVINWGSYKHLTVDVQAQLIVNGSAFLDPVVITLVAPDPIESIEADNARAEKQRNADKEATSFNVLSAIDVHLLADPKGTFAADLFAKNSSRYPYREASAYDATFSVDGEASVYYYNAEGEKETYSSELYKVTTDQEGQIYVNLMPESAFLQTNVYAEVPVKVEYALNGDVDYKTTTTKKTTVTVTFLPPVK